MESGNGAEQLSRAIQRRRRKQTKIKANDDGQWGRCMFKVLRKKRYCNIARVPGSLFCGNHLPESDVLSCKKSQKFKFSTRRRVPCPVDKSHTVYEYDLAKHVQICNRVKDADVMKNLPFYSHNINSGLHSIDKKEKTFEEEVDENGHLNLSAKVQQSIIDRLQAIDFANLRSRIEVAYASCVGELASEHLHHNCCDELFETKKTSGSSNSVLRHIKQQASIIGHMDKVKLLANPDSAFVELGAGRGLLSLALAQTYPDSLFVLIDRAHTRGKADHFIGRNGMNDVASKKSPTTLRAKIDIRHLNFAGMQEISNKPVICMSKHLCGVATDLSLRAITQTLPETDSDISNLSKDAPASVNTRFKGLAIALCCHHVCTWGDYVNPEFFLTYNFKPEEFELLTCMTSWTTCGMGLKGDAVKHILGISKDERAELGRKCKRIIDAGRAAYLAQFQLKTRLVQYCDANDSLENCLLLAWR
ncbi:putative methyltransferase TRM13, Zinc finger, CCCH-type, TRM13 [Plasmopara halstedii]